jgi:hypothetical protein
MNTYKIDIVIQDVSKWDEASEVAGLLTAELGGKFRPTLVMAKRASINPATGLTTYTDNIHHQVAVGVESTVGLGLVNVILKRATRVGWNLYHKGIPLEEDRSGFFEAMLRGVKACELYR